MLSIPRVGSSMQLLGGLVLLGEVVPELTEKENGIQSQANFVAECASMPLHVGFDLPLSYRFPILEVWLLSQYFSLFSLDAKLLNI